MEEIPSVAEGGVAFRCRFRVPPVENRHVAKLELILFLNVPELEIRSNLDNPDDSDAKERLSCNK